MASVEDRIALLERDLTRLDQQDIFATQQLKALAPLPTQIVRMEGALASLREAMADLRREIAALRTAATEQTKEQSEERRALKLALIGLTGVILAALIGGVFVLVASHG
jgi:citrate synthase